MSIRKDYPTTGVLKRKLDLSTGDSQDCLIRKDYPTTGVLKRILQNVFSVASGEIRKDYPTTGVLKLLLSSHLVDPKYMHIRKDYPTTGVLKPCL